jgi:alpha-tubulin suppressor-like RCC1 family protein
VVAGVANAVKLSVGYQHACAVMADQTMSCWGNSRDGRTGNGTTNNPMLAWNVYGVGTATNVSAGRDQTCAVMADQTAYCWGGDDSGES